MASTLLDGGVGFVHIPKTGGTSITYALYCLGLARVSTTFPHIIPSVPFRFAFVRHPVTWLRSLYCHLSRIDWRYPDTFGLGELAPERFRSDNLDDFVDWIYSYHQAYVREVFYHFIGEPRYRINYVGRQENLFDDFEEALTLAGIWYDRDILNGLRGLSYMSNENFGGSLPVVSKDLLHFVEEREGSLLDEFGYTPQTYE